MKKINWAKWYNISGTLVVVGAAISFAWNHSTLGQIPGQVSALKTQVSDLKDQVSTNQVHTDDRLDELDKDIKNLYQRLGEDPAIEASPNTNTSLADQR